MKITTRIKMRICWPFSRRYFYELADGESEDELLGEILIVGSDVVEELLGVVKDGVDPAELYGGYHHDRYDISILLLLILDCLLRPLTHFLFANILVSRIRV